MSDDKNAFSKEFVIHIIDEYSVEELMVVLVQNGYSVAWRQDKKALIVKIANYYFKEDTD